MKTLTAATDLARRRPYATQFYGLQIEFTAPSAKTLRFSDRYLSMLGQEWLPFVVDWGNLEEVLNARDADGAPAIADGIALLNTKPIEGKGRLSDLIRTPGNTSGTYEWTFAKTTIYQLFEGLGTGDGLPLGALYLEDPSDIGADVLRIRMIDQAGVIEKRLNVKIVNRMDFPRCAESAIGASLVRPFGVLRLPGVPVVDSITSRLNGAMTSAATTLTVDDASRFPTSGTLQIDSEHMTYSGKSGNSLTGLTRGTDGSTAAAHLNRATVYEVRQLAQSYRYAIGEHLGNFKIKSVANVTVDGEPPAIAPSIELEETGLVSGRNFAIISFPREAKFFTSGTVLGERDVAVTTISITLNGGAGSPTSPQTRTVAPSSGGGTISTDRILNCHVTRGGNLVGTVNSWTIKRRISGGDDLIVAAGSFAEFVGGTTNVSHTQIYISTADEVLTFEFVVNNTNDGTLDLVFDQYHVKDRGAGGSGPVDIGVVAADVEGIKDDTSGTITGTPGLPLENPADVTKFILTQLYGVASADIGATFAVTRARLAAEGYRWAFPLEYQEFSRLRGKLGEQARSVLSLTSGIWQYAYQPPAPVPSFTLEYDRELNKDRPAAVGRIPRVDVVNSLTVRATHDYIEGIDRSVILVEDLTQPGLAERLSGELTLDLVQDPAIATALGGYWLTRRQRPLLTVDLLTWWSAIAAEVGDYFRIQSHPILAAYGGADLIFRIISLERDLATARIRLKGVEAALLPEALTTEEEDGEMRAGHLWGLTLSNNGTDPTNDIDIAVGEAVSDEATSASRVLMELTSGLTKQLDATWAAGTNAGGRVSGQTLADGTWHVFLFRRQAGAIDVCFSNSLTFTTPDSGTNRRRIGSVVRASAAIRLFSQSGDRFDWSSPILDVDTTTASTSAVTFTFSVPIGIVVLAHYNALMSGDNYTYISSLTQADLAPSTTAAPLSQFGVGTNGASGNGSVLTNASGQARRRSAANTTIRIATIAYTDRRGRDA